jgi:hypothetical protein
MVYPNITWVLMRCEVDNLENGTSCSSLFMNHQEPKEVISKG